MNRTFMEHKLRKTFFLDGLWDFQTDEKEIGEKNRWYDSLPENCARMSVPYCWNLSRDLRDFYGVAWYQTHFYASGKHLILKFHGVSEQCRVFLDGKQVGEHYGSFTSFEIDVKNTLPGMHTLTVRVDSRSTDDTIPLQAVDWFHFGGILRSVEVMEMKDVVVRGIKAEYELDDTLSSANLHLCIPVDNLEDTKRDAMLRVFLNDRQIFSQQVQICGKAELRVNLHLDHIQLWTMENPRLYEITIQLGEDDLTDRIGFRRVEVRDRQILLNGNPLTLKGINRHEDHPDFGFALPLPIMQKDMEMIKSMGCNTIRGSHYPNHQSFLDMCDENGILFWSEIPMWGFDEEHLKRPLILERGMTMHREMVTQYYNHPSIILWGMHNEIDTRTQAAYDLTRAFRETILSCDRSRLLTYATMYFEKDICLELADIISINKYIGWYEDSLTNGEAVENWKRFLTCVEERTALEQVSDRPVLISEFGAGALYGTRELVPCKWSEDYQCSLMTQLVPLFLASPTLSGFYIWQYCDMHSDAEWALNRARSYNNKGIVNEYRKPKLAYYALKALLTGNQQNT